MQTFQSRFNQSLEHSGLTRNGLAKKIGLSATAIAKIARGETLNSKYIFHIAEALDVDPVWLKTGEGVASLPVAACEKRDVVRVGVLNVTASAGGGVVPFEAAEIVRYVDFSRDFFERHFKECSAKGINLISVKGDSMAPTLEKDALVFVNTAVKNFECDGVYVFTYDDRLFVKRLQAVGRNIRVISDNPLYPAWDIDQAETFILHGKVVTGLNWVSVG